MSERDLASAAARAQRIGRAAAAARREADRAAGETIDVGPVTVGEPARPVEDRDRGPLEPAIRAAQAEVANWGHTPGDPFPPVKSYAIERILRAALPHLIEAGEVPDRVAEVVSGEWRAEGNLIRQDGRVQALAVHEDTARYLVRLANNADRHGQQL